MLGATSSPHHLKGGMQQGAAQRTQPGPEASPLSPGCRRRPPRPEHWRACRVLAGPERKSRWTPDGHGYGHGCPAQAQAPVSSLVGWVCRSALEEP